MISRIRGKLTAVLGGAAQIEMADGMTYEVLLPAYMHEGIARAVGSMVSLITLQYLEGQGQGTSFIPRLIGFASESDRRFFDVFTTVKGIGNRKALRAMAVEPARIAALIMGKDAKGLTELPEIGKRLAETVIAELTGKVDVFLTAAEVSSLNQQAEAKPVSKTTASEEAVAALIALGETPQNAERKVAIVLGKAAGKTLSTDDIVAAVYGG